jgi:hypothetical protein
MDTKSKPNYRIRNWKEYDAALKHRGSITFWINEEVVEQWRNKKKTGRKGASNYYSDVAIAPSGEQFNHCFTSQDGRHKGF